MSLRLFGRACRIWIAVILCWHVPLLQQGMAKGVEATLMGMQWWHSMNPVLMEVTVMPKSWSTHLGTTENVQGLIASAGDNNEEETCYRRSGPRVGPSTWKMPWRGRHLSQKLQRARLLPENLKHATWAYPILDVSCFRMGILWPIRVESLVMKRRYTAHEKELVVIHCFMSGL